jgi:hypothetical protein
LQRVLIKKIMMDRSAQSEKEIIFLFYSTNLFKAMN